MIDKKRGLHTALFIFLLSKKAYYILTTYVFYDRIIVVKMHGGYI